MCQSNLIIHETPSDQDRSQKLQRLPMHKVGGAINGIDNPGGSICQAALFTCSNGFFADEPRWGRVGHQAALASSIDHTMSITSWFLYQESLRVSLHLFSNLGADHLLDFLIPLRDQIGSVALLDKECASLR